MYDFSERLNQGRGPPATSASIVGQLEKPTKEPVEVKSKPNLLSGTGRDVKKAVVQLGTVLVEFGKETVVACPAHVTDCHFRLHCLLLAVDPNVYDRSAQAVFGVTQFYEF
jgi:hypothetical protein